MKMRASSNPGYASARLRQVFGQSLVLALFFESIAAASPVEPAFRVPSHDVSGSGTESVFVRRYSEEELAYVLRPADKEEPSFARHVSSLLQSVGSDASTHEAFKKLHSESNNRDLRSEDISRFYSPRFETGSMSTVAVSEKLRESTARQVSSRLMRESVFLQALSGGMEFKMNLSGFGRKTEARADAPQPVRYGLVLRSIEPSFDGARSAAVGEFRPEDLSHAGKARPIWGIGPLEQEAMLPLYSTSYDDAPASGWEGFFASLPRPDFSGKIVPKAAPSLGSGDLPPMLMTIDQAQGFYRLEYHTRSNFKKEAVLHAVSLPLYERVRMGQTLDESWTFQRTSVENVLNGINGPRLNLHYLTTNEHYQSDLLYNFETTQFIFTTDAPHDWKPGQSPDERYEFKIQRTF